MTNTELAAILRPARAILLDFDGPVCSLFAGYPARQITAGLHALAADLIGTLPPALAEATGPHEVLYATASIGRDLAHRLEEALQVAETKAAESATPTPGAREFLDASSETGRPVAIVSNNCAAAVHAYLDRAGLADHAQHIEARGPVDPGLMKPNPYLVKRAADALRIPPGDSVLIGDQPTDIQAGRAIGVRTIGYANKPGKAHDLGTAHPDALTDSMNVLARVLRRSASTGSAT